MQYILSIWEYVVNFLEVFLFFIFMNTKLSTSYTINNIKVKQWGFLFAKYILLCFLNQFTVPTVVVIVISCITDLIYSILFFNNSILSCIFWGFVFSVICLISESITALIPQAITSISLDEVLFGGTLRIPFTMLYIALIALFVLLLSYILNSKIILSAMQKITYSITSIVGLMLGHYMLTITIRSIQLAGNKEFTQSLVIVDIFFLLMFLSVLVYIYRLGLSNEKNRQLLEIQKLQELEELEYNNLIENTACLREMKHDMEFHLNMIHDLAKKEKLEDLLNYIDGYLKSLEQTHHFVSTGNTAIDCILSSKIDTATKANIKVDYSVMIPSVFPLEPFILSSLLGNLWNNAIEANLRMGDASYGGEHFINFHIKPFQGMVTIHMENSYDGILNLTSESDILSSKLGLNHGIGLKLIHKIVDDADGIMQIQTGNNIFTVHILLPADDTICTKKYTI